MTGTNEKPAVEAGRGNDELENPDTPKDIAVEAAAKGQGISGYETLSLWETVRTFKVNSAYCFLMAFSAATDGYQIGLVSYQCILSFLPLYGNNRCQTVE